MCHAWIFFSSKLQKKNFSSPFKVTYLHTKFWQRSVKCVYIAIDAHLHIGLVSSSVAVFPGSASPIPS